MDTKVRLSLALLGSFEVTLDGHPISFESVKVKVQPEVTQDMIGEEAQQTNGNGTEPEAAAPARSRRRRNQPQEGTPVE